MPPIAFAWEEGRCLQFLDGLLERDRGEPLTEPVSLERVRPELLQVGARRIARGCVRWLVDGGGWRARRVIRGGRRAVGRAWDPALGEGFGLRFTDATRTLWLQGAALLPSLGGRGGARVDLGVLAPRGETATGDWVFAALAAESSPALRLAPRHQEALLRALRGASPLVALMYPSPERTGDAMASAAERLVAGSASRILECGEDRVARAWAECAAQAMREGGEADALALRWRSLGAAMRALCEAADRAGRADLLRPAAKALAEMLATTFSAGGESVRRKLSAARGLRSVRERDALLEAVGTVAAVGVWLLRRRDELGAERYGDARYEEAQVLLRDVDEVLGPSRRKVEGLARALSGEVG